MTIAMSSVVHQSDEQVAAEVDGEVVMMSVERGNYYGLDEVGSRIWALIDSPKRVAEVCDILVSEFDVERATCEGDVVRFLEELADQGLVVVDGPLG